MGNKPIQKDRQWFYDRIGKRVYRTKSTCPCSVCAAVYKKGLIITDYDHANYLLDCEGEIGLLYFDTKKEVKDYEVKQEIESL